MEVLLIAKIGGNIIDDERALDRFLDDFVRIRGHKILVHGGGKLATELSSRLGIETQMVDGRRITDAETVKVVTMVYAGLINKNITALLQAKDANAIGLCGVDGAIVPAIKRPVKEIDYGWVGDILTDQINYSLLINFLKNELLPVIAPISGSEGKLLNINADTMASAIARSLSGSFNVTLVFCFEKNGLLSDVEDENSVIPAISGKLAQTLKQSGAISKGMVPKIDNAFDAFTGGVKRVVIGHASHIHQIAAGEKGYGTTIET